MIFVSDRITFGNPKDREAGVRIRAEGIKAGHGFIEKRDGAYSLTAGTGQCAVSRESVSDKRLEPEDEILLGKRFKMKASVSPGCLLLMMEDSNPVDGTLRGIVLLNRYLDIGPDENVHIHVPRMAAGVRLTYESGSFAVETGSGKMGIEIGGEIEFEGTKMFITVS